MKTGCGDGDGSGGAVSSPRGGCAPRLVSGRVGVGGSTGHVAFGGGVGAPRDIPGSVGALRGVRNWDVSAGLTGGSVQLGYGGGVVGVFGLGERRVYAEAGARAGSRSRSRSRSCGSQKPGVPARVLEMAIGPFAEAALEERAVEALEVPRGGQHVT